MAVFARSAVTGFGAGLSAYLFGGGESIECMPMSTKPKGFVWQCYNTVPPIQPNGPNGLACAGFPRCDQVYYQKVPNATTLARHSATCAFLPQDMRDRVNSHHKTSSRATQGTSVYMMSPTETNGTG